MEPETVVMPRSVTAENGAKGLMSGEFYTEHQEECLAHGEICFDENCLDCKGMGSFTVKTIGSWTTIKEIYAMAVKHLAE